jgi:phenylacetate-coenzyme A ligase PaaK-like adenylate-forming protein
LFEALLRREGNGYQYFKKLDKWQWLDTKENKTIQERQLKQLLVQSYQHVPYYRDILTAAKVIDKNGEVCLNNFSYETFIHWRYHAGAICRPKI